MNAYRGYAFFGFALMAISLGWLMWLAAIALTGCAAFIGPATSSSDDYMIRCGDTLCDPRYYECSRTKPFTCRAAPMLARDAGADR